MLFAFPGCSPSYDSGEPPVADYSKVRMMTGFYEGYMKDHRNQPPKDEQAFRDYLNTKQDNLQKAGLTVDQMFISPRGDNRLKWVYARRPPVDKQSGMVCYAYEAEPVNGKRFVLGGRGMVAELEESQFKADFPQG